MNYRHTFHAGNFADIHKHVALLAAFRHLQKKVSGFVFIDTHAGRGLYDLAGTDARRSGEAAHGIFKLKSLVPVTEIVADYLGIIRSFGENLYPGSPLIAAKLLRPQDRIVAVEKHPEECAHLGRCLESVQRFKTLCADGFTQLPRVMPPPERRGLALIDPSFEDAEDRGRLARAAIDAYRRFPTGIYLIWLPLKDMTSTNALLGEFQSAGIDKLLFLRFDIGLNSRDLTGRLSASGLIAVNPPYGFDMEMKAAQAELLPILSRSTDASEDVRWVGAAVRS